MKSETAMPCPVGYLVSQYPAVNHTFILREIRTLRKLGFDVRVVSIRKPDRPVEKLSDDEADEQRQSFSVMGYGIPSAILANYRVFIRRPFVYVKTLWFSLSLTRGTPRLLLPYITYFLEAVVAGWYFEQEKVRHIHSHFSSTVLLILSRLFPVKYSLTIHGPDEFNDVVGFHMAEKVKGAVFISTISHYAASQVMKASDPVYWEKVRPIPLGVDPAEFSPRDALPKLPEDPFRLVFVGRLAPAKAQHILIEAVSQLLRGGRNVELNIVGEGPSRQSLECLVEQLGLTSRVNLLGACNHDQVASHLRRSDAFVLASFAEGVPVVLMEAMAVGLPCISTWITGIPELIDNELDGLLVPPASAEAIAVAVGRLMDNDELASKIGAAGREKILAKYHLQNNTEQLSEVLVRVLDESW